MFFVPIFRSINSKSPCFQKHLIYQKQISSFQSLSTTSKCNPKNSVKNLTNDSQNYTFELSKRCKHFGKLNEIWNQCISQARKLVKYDFNQQMISSHDGVFERLFSNNSQKMNKNEHLQGLLR